MPGTHLLPPNLLKLFAPRPPLPYTRPLDRDIDRVRPKKVDGVGPLLASLREAKTQGMMESGNTGEERDGMEEGEEPAFTYAEETKRQVEKHGRKCFLHATDLKKKENCQKVVDEAVREMGTINILFNNHGYQKVADDIKDLSEEQWLLTFDTNIHRELVI